MNFNDFEYVKPDFEKYKLKFDKLINDMNNADDFSGFDEAINEIINLRKEYETMQTISSIRYSINTLDKFYEEQQNYFDSISPYYEGILNKISKLILESKYLKEIENKYGKQIIVLLESAIKTFDEIILSDMQQENNLKTEYRKLTSQAKINFEGKEYTLSQMSYFMQQSDRNLRKRAYESYWKFFIDKKNEFNRIYDQLVSVRSNIAKKLNYENFINLGYFRLARSDYNSAQVEKFRSYIKKYIVPIAQKVYKNQAKRLGLSKLSYYDESVFYKSGNPKPKGTPKELVSKALMMYQKIDKNIGDFFSMLINSNLLDVESKPGKAPIGYCTFIQKYQVPFIFANFNGTTHDVEVLTHETGHAFQSYMSKDYPFPEYQFPTLEAAEIFSMSMEFITYPFMNLFFESEDLKFKYQHICGAITFIPYAALVDEFQHKVFEDKNIGAQKINSIWSELTKEYLPQRDYSENPELEEGITWFRQSHIFEVPFYYIDYALAQIVAFQFWMKNEKNNKKAWEDYYNLCKIGGSKSFIDIINSGNLENPFEESTIKNISIFLENYLETINDEELDR